MATTPTKTTRTRKPAREPETVTVEIPDVGAPGESETLSEPTIEDFAKIAPDIKPPTPRSKGKVVGKRTTVESELQRLREELSRNVSFLGLLACAKDPYGGQLILMNKDSLIEKWIDVCRINPTIRHALLSAMDMGVYATAITSTLAVVIAFLAHAKMLPNSEMILGAIGGAGVTLPSDEQVMQTEAMFAAMGSNGNG